MKQRDLANILPSGATVIRLLKCPAGGAPQKWVWHCRAADGVPFVLKVVRSDRAVALDNECRALNHLSGSFCQRVRLPRVLWTCAGPSTTAIATEFILEKVPDLDARRAAVECAAHSLLAADPLNTGGLGGAHAAAAAAASRAVGPWGLCHGDFSPEHLLFGVTTRESDATWYLIDWEHAHYGSVIRDWANFLTAHAVAHHRTTGQCQPVTTLPLFPPIATMVAEAAIPLDAFRDELQLAAQKKIEYLFRYQLDTASPGREESAFLQSFVYTADW